jgi:hypothetical protein
MTDTPVVLVAGLGRCGSSLVMQMLEAAGLPCLGEYPGFEDARFNHCPVPADLLRSHAGHAVKCLNPHLTPLAYDAPWIVVWLDRNLTEQARSQIKFATVFMRSAPPTTRRDLRRMAAGLREERGPAMRAFAGRPRTYLQFEEIVASPSKAAYRLAKWLEPWHGVLDERAMAAVVRPRGPECQPGIEMEIALLEEREGWTA